MNLPLETQIYLDKFKPRFYQLPLLDALENKGYRRIVGILPRRAGKDITAFNLCLRQLLRETCVVYYIFPTYAQGKKALWDSITNDGTHFLDFIPPRVIESKNSQEMKLRFVNGSIFQIIGSDNYDCFDDQTEILTNDGWKLFKDLNRNETVASLVDGKMEFVSPLAYQEYEYKGDMYGVSNSSLDFLVTPNHRFFVSSHRGKSKFKEISDPSIKGDMIPAFCEWEGKTIQEIEGYKAEDFVAFLGIYLSEGSCYESDNGSYEIIISQKKESIRNDIRALLLRMGINFYESADRFGFCNKKIYEYVKQFGLQKDRFIPREVKELNPSLLSILFDWLIKGDGHTCKTYTAYYSISKRLIDDVQELILKLGLSGNVYQRKQKESFIKDRRVKSKHVLYEVRIRKSKYKRFVGASGKEYIFTKQYEGRVYCVSVPSGVIKVRRNGKEVWSGNSLRGTNPKGVVFSEYAMQDPRAYAEIIRPILAANQGWAIFISTPRGKNHMWSLYNVAKESPEWFCYKLTVEDTQHIDLWEIEKERREGLMSEDLIQQEYFCSFEMGVEGSYYAKYLDKMRLEGRIDTVPWESAFKVHTAWDIGVRDSTCIIFFQTIGQTVRIIDYYENSKEGLEHYVQVLNKKPYTYGRHFAPHDIAVKEWGSGLTRIEKARHLGITFTLAPNHYVEDGIEAVRSSFSKIWIDKTRCEPLLKALENYRQEWDEKRMVYKGIPLHNWASHAADAMRYLCLSLPKTRDGLTPEELNKRYTEALYGRQGQLPPMFRDDYQKY